MTEASSCRTEVDETALAAAEPASFGFTPLSNTTNSVPTKLDLLKYKSPKKMPGMIDGRDVFSIA